MRQTLYDETVSQAWGEWIAGMGEWHVFGGLTYDPDKRPRDASSDAPIKPTADTARRHVVRWLRDAPHTLGRPVEAAVVALEYQRNGWPHFHPLLRLPGGLQGNEFQRLGQAWFQRHGFARLEVPDDRSAVCSYAAKYLAKDLDRGDVIFWPLRGQLVTHQPSLADEQLAELHGEPARAGSRPGRRSAARGLDAPRGDATRRQ